jgi:hypothetical protein
VDKREMTMHSDYFEKFYPKEYLVEELCVVEDTAGPYLRLRWYVEDPDPGADWYLTEIGSSPKKRLEREGKVYMSSDISWVAKS